MWNIILILVIPYLSYFSSEVESLLGSKVVSADYQEFPFIAALLYLPAENYQCTGSLITRRHVITAAHCLQDENFRTIQIAFGMTSLPTNNLKYTIASWETFEEWAARLGIGILPGEHDIAIITLTNNVCQRGVRPVRLSELNKKQVQGKNATFIGWKTYGTAKQLQKATVDILSDEDCIRYARLVTNDVFLPNPRIICSHAEPYVLSDYGDSGAPTLDESGNLLGVHRGYAPFPEDAWGNFSLEFIRKYLYNADLSVDYYRQFIIDATKDP